MATVAAAAGVAGAAAMMGDVSMLRGQDAPRPAAREKLKLFDYADVKLTGGPLKEQYDRNHQFLSEFDEDRILSVYRQHAKMPAPDEPMGGWYDLKGFGPGHAFGQWLSAMSRVASATNDPQLKAKCVRLVEKFGATVKQPPDSFYAAYRFPAYTYDKTVLGLMDAYRLAGASTAPKVLSAVTEAVLPVLPEKSLTREEMAARPHKDISFTWDEHYTMPENLFYAHELTGDARYLELAKRFLHDKPYFDPLAAGKNVLPGLHAYSHVNALSSAARAYLVLGDEKHFLAIRNAWDMIHAAQQFASGGWGPNEAFVEPGKGKLGDSLATTRNHFETPCGAYAHFKLARYLLRFTGDSRYADSMERVLYNTILAAKQLRQDGSSFYYSDYQAKAKKVFHPDKWPCCSGTYPQAVADYLLNIYMHDEKGVYVNLYAPSEVKWKGVTLTQTTDYPDSGDVSIRVSTQSPQEFALFLRVPAWSGAITVDGKSVPTSAGSYAPLRRKWSDGDTIQLNIPLAERTEPVDAQHPDLVAHMRGPVMMVKLDSGERRPFYQVMDEIYTTYEKKGA